MKKTSSPLLQPRSPLLILLFLTAAAMAAEPEQNAAPAAAAQEAAVHIVYVDRPEGADPEEFHLRTLTPVLGRRPRTRCSTTTSTPPAGSPRSSPPSKSRS
ncbi:hypothetical protein PVAP13_3KG123674 [Panicum virgatum]|uniref:Uncharacterized protein n=1 Tax=Panicum virgatum TaxID=38727 RepID=A0A8T0UYG5_PANVG|nr:hypothetical protein PVAP13_3KG123674 [Panicum virgatum]